MAKKFFLTWILAIALVFAMTVVGCDDNSTDNSGNGNGNGGIWGNPPSELVGTWLTMGVSPVLVINADGTGTMGGDPVNSWKVKGSELKMDYSGVESIVKWNVSGNTLTLSYPSDTSTIGLGNTLIAYSPLTRKTETDSPPEKLGSDATQEDVLAVLEEIIANPNTPPEIKQQAEEMIAAITAPGAGPISPDDIASYIDSINNMIDEIPVGGVSIDGWTWTPDDDSFNGGTSTINMEVIGGNKIKLTGKLTADCPNDPWEPYGYVNCGAEPDNTKLAELKNSNGFSFKCQGDGGSYYVQVRTSDITDYAYYQLEFETSGAEKTIEILYDELEQLSWGIPVAFNKNRITAINFEAHTNTKIGNFSLTIWDMHIGVTVGAVPDNGWNVWRDNTSTATMNYSIANDGLCTVTVGGTPHQHSNGVWEAWKVSAEYNYTGVAGKAYEFKFEAWTQSGVRDLHVQYYNDNNDQVYLGETFPITNTRTTYTIHGEPLPKSGNRPLSFQVADQTGTVYLKVLEIKELISGGNNNNPISPSFYTVTVTFNANGGSGWLPDPITVLAGASIELTDGSGLYRDGYTFIGWSDGQGSYWGSAATTIRVMFSADTVLYAEWEAIGGNPGDGAP